MFVDGAKVPDSITYQNSDVKYISNSAIEEMSKNPNINAFKIQNFGIK